MKDKKGMDGYPVDMVATAVKALMPKGGSVKSITIEFDDDDCDDQTEPGHPDPETDEEAYGPDKAKALKAEPKKK